MSEDYVQEKARTALAAAQGDKDAAQKLLVAWAVRDQTLLLGLAKAHLKALANLALERAAKDSEAATDTQAPLADSLLGKLMNQVGVRRPSSRLPDAEPVLDPARQAQTWQTIAESFKKKS